MKKSAKQTLSPALHQAEYQAQISTTYYISDTFHGNSTKTWSPGELLLENCQNVFLKTCVNFGRCYGNQEWAEAVEKYFFVLKISSFKFSESVK